MSPTNIIAMLPRFAKARGNSRQLGTLSKHFETVESFRVWDACGTVVQTPDFDYCSRLNEELPEVLSSQEFEIAKNLKGALRRNSFLGGRVALRRSVRELDESISVPCIRTDCWGAPILPQILRGSVSHKDDLAVGLVGIRYAEDPREYHIGVDIERVDGKMKSGSSSLNRMSNRILTRNEQSKIGGLTGLTADEEIFLHFSLKESFYKAIHPFVRTFIGMREVEVYPSDDGNAVVHFLMPGELIREQDLGEESRMPSSIVRNGIGDTCTFQHQELSAKWFRYCDRYCVTAVKVSREEVVWKG